MNHNIELIVPNRKYRWALEFAFSVTEKSELPNEKRDMSAIIKNTAVSAPKSQNKNCCKIITVPSLMLIRFTNYRLRFTIPRMDIEAEYNKALDYLYSFVDYSLKHSSELAKAEFNLDRMYALMEELGNPQNKYPIIHVEGTKGKGSVCALCASALQAAGYNVGLFTSPHLLDYCERIQVNGEPISHAFMVELVEEIKPAVTRIPKLTTFEITTALGFLAFARQACNAAVIEVGLGGRLDATNIVTNKVSVITSLSYDHMAVLGDTLAKIAGEKAGIIKPGVPVVSAPQKDEALEVLERVANLHDSKFFLIGKDVKFERIESSLDE